MPEQALPAEESLPTPPAQPRTNTPPANTTSRSSGAEWPEWKGHQMHRSVRPASAESPVKKYLGFGGDFE
jgi:hypothetical protein